MTFRTSVLAMLVASVGLHFPAHATGYPLLKPGQAPAAPAFEAPTIPGAKLGAEWAQMTYSIPAAVNPVNDATGALCEVGQRGDVWYLHGSFGGAVERECTIPADMPVAFPILTYTVFDTPGICGQEGSMTDEAMRALAREVMDTVDVVEVTLDGQTMNSISRLRSDIFPLYVPTDNVFNAGCPGGIPRANYRAYDEGFYSQIGALSEGVHTLRFYGHSTLGFEVQASYKLNVKRVVR